MWDPSPSGNLNPLYGYRLFKLSIENDLDEGTDFKIDETIGGLGTALFVTGLRGGVEYLFKLMAINSNLQTSSASEGLSFIAGHEKPLAMRTLRASPAADPDLGSHYRLMLSWVIPSQVDPKP